MKLGFKLLMVVLVIGGLLSFSFLKGDDGNSLFSVSDLKMPNFPFLGLAGSKKSSKTEGPRGEVIIYKWTDVEGNLQFSNQPPAEGIEYTLKKYDPNENVVPAVSTDSPDIVVDLSPGSERNSSATGNAGSVYSPGVIEKLFEDANNVSKLEKNRIKNLNATLGQ